MGGFRSARTRTGELVVVPAVADGRGGRRPVEPDALDADCAVWLPQHRWVNSCMGALPPQHPENDDARFLRTHDGAPAIDDGRRRRPPGEPSPQVARDPQQVTRRPTRFTRRGSGSAPTSSGARPGVGPEISLRIRDSSGNSEISPDRLNSPLSAASRPEGTGRPAPPEGVVLARIDRYRPTSRNNTARRHEWWITE